VNKPFSLPENLKQTAKILKSENEALKPSLQMSFLQNFSSLAYTQANLDSFLIFFQENFRKTLKRIPEISKIKYADL
jgi:hypothetical protein